MKYLKRFSLIILILLALFYIIGFFLPKKTTVSRSAIINGTLDQTYLQINELKNWNNWSVWNKLDTTMSKTYSEPSAGKDAFYSWDSKNNQIGKGKITLAYSSKDSIICGMDFMENGTATAKFILEKIEAEKTKVTWSLNAEHSGSMDRWMGLMLNSIVGKDYETSLNNLNNYISNLPKKVEKENPVTLTKISATPYIYLNKISDSKYFEKDREDMFEKLYEYLKTQKAVASGKPFAIIHKDKNVITSYDFCLPINSEMKLIGNINKDTIPEMEVLNYEYSGDYKNIDSAYLDIKNWMKENKKKQADEYWEEYIVLPSENEDTTQWLTKIYMPVE